VEAQIVNYYFLGGLLLVGLAIFVVGNISANRERARRRARRDAHARLALGPRARTEVPSTRRYRTGTVHLAGTVREEAALHVLLASEELFKHVVTVMQQVRKERRRLPQVVVRLSRESHEVPRTETIEAAIRSAWARPDVRSQMMS
jgi:hypothetical protein